MRLLPEMTALTRLRQLSVSSRTLPAVAGLTGVSRLSIGGLHWTQEVGTQVGSAVLCPERSLVCLLRISLSLLSVR